MARPAFASPQPVQRKNFSGCVSFKLILWCSHTDLAKTSGTFPKRVEFWREGRNGANPLWSTEATPGIIFRLIDQSEAELALVRFVCCAVGGFKYFRISFLPGKLDKFSGGAFHDVLHCRVGKGLCNYSKLDWFFGGAFFRRELNGEPISVDLWPNKSTKWSFEILFGQFGAAQVAQKAEDFRWKLLTIGFSSPPTLLCWKFAGKRWATELRKWFTMETMFYYTAYNCYSPPTLTGWNTLATKQEFRCTIRISLRHESCASRRVSSSVWHKRPPRPLPYLSSFWRGSSWHRPTTMRGGQNLQCTIKKDDPDGVDDDDDHWHRS